MPDQGPSPTADHDQSARRRAAVTGPDLSRLPHQLTPTDMGWLATDATAPVVLLDERADGQTQLVSADEPEPPAQIRYNLDEALALLDARRRPGCVGRQPATWPSW